MDGSVSRLPFLAFGDRRGAMKSAVGGSLARFGWGKAREVLRGRGAALQRGRWVLAEVWLGGVEGVVELGCYEFGEVGHGVAFAQLGLQCALQPYVEEIVSEEKQQ